MAKKNKRAVNESSVLLSEEKTETQSGFWSGLGRGERIAAVAVCLLLSMGALGATGLGGKIVSLFTSKDTNAANTSSTGNIGSSLSSLNPFSPAPPPSATPQLSKEYIYAGSRMLAVEDANASAAPPADLAVWRPSNGYWYVLGGQGSQQTSFQWGQNNDKPVPGDFDGDGKTDFSVFRPSTGYWYVSNSSSNTLTSVFFGASDDKPAPADFDGDGKTDVAVYRPSTGYWYISLSGSNQAIVSYYYGGQSDTPVPADYDGDGKADIAIWQNLASLAPNARYYILTSTSNYAAQLTITFPFSDVNDKAVPGDYDGDGKADPVVWRNSGSEQYHWRIYNSATQTISTAAVYGSPSSDVAVQNDYDGDGKVDIAFWRPSEGKWYIQKSTGGGRTEVWGQSGDIPVPAFYRR